MVEQVVNGGIVGAFLIAQQVLHDFVNGLDKPSFGINTAHIRQLAYAAAGILINFPEASFHCCVYDCPCYAFFHYINSPVQETESFCKEQYKRGRHLKTWTDTEKCPKQEMRR